MATLTSQAASADPGPQVQTTFLLRGVQFGYHTNRPVLHDVDATFRAGRLTALLGPNAAGKSTLIKLMLGQAKLWRGQVLFEGRPIMTLTPAERARAISYVPQRSEQTFGYTVREMVRMARYPHVGTSSRHNATVLRQAMEACDISHLADRVYNQLSGGQQQRVMLARAIAQSHGSGRVMLLDEPAAGLDLCHMHAMMTHLRTLCSEGRAVVIVMHDLNLAAQYADDVCLMNAGRVIAAGTRNDVLKPDTLAPVYDVDFADLRPVGADRPVFAVGYPRTIDTPSSDDGPEALS